MNREFKHFWEIGLQDINRHPFWICCELEDENQPWYNDIEPSAFRPYLDGLPVAETCGLVRTIATLKNGAMRDGIAFFNGNTLASPEIFLGETRTAFQFNNTDGEDSNLNLAVTQFKQEFQTELESVFPIHMKTAKSVLSKTHETTVKCLTSIAIFDGSLSEQHIPEIAG